MKNVRIKIGDVFSVSLDENSKKYFQYIADDQSQLNSSVIRVFAKRYPLDDQTDPDTIIAGEVQFYAHVVVRWGLRLGSWEKVGHATEVGTSDILFRGTDDCFGKVGEERVRVSHQWYVWRINGEFQRVGPLTDKYREAEIGVVVTAGDIVDRMRTGKYDFAYPE